MKIRLLTILIAIISVPIIAWSQSTESKIQGTWRLDGTNGKTPWFIEWTFANGNFTQIAYPPISQKGKYKIIEEKGVQIKLEFLEQTGTFGTENRQIIILIDAKRKELTIDRNSGFIRKSKDVNTQIALEFLKKFNLSIDETIPVTLIDIDFPKAFTSLPWAHYQAASEISGFDLELLKGCFAKLHKYTLVEKSKTPKGEFTKFAYLAFQHNKLVGAWWSDSSPSAPNINGFRK